MADNELTIRISAATDEFVKKVDDAKTKVRSLSAQMAEIDKQLKTESVDRVGKLTEKLDLAKRAAQMAAKEVDFYGKEIADITAKAGSAAEMTDKQRKKVLELSEKMAQAQQRANTFAQQVDQLGQELQDTGSAAEDTAEKIEDTGKAADDAGQSTLKFGDIIKADLISSAIKKGLSVVLDIFKSIASAAISAVKGVGKFIGETIELAKNMEETKSKVAAVFGEQGQKQIEDWASNAAHDFHTTKQSAMEAASAFGNILLNMGMAQKQAQSYSQELVLVAAAQADFNNMETVEVLDKIQSALAGNYKGLQSLGIVIKETDIQERALANTRKENADQLTDMEKKEAALQIILEKSAFAVQKYEENSGSLVSMQGELKAKLEDVKTEIGTRLYPVAENIFQKIIEFTNTQQFTDLLDTIYDSFSTIGDAVLEFINSGKLDEYIQWMTDNLPHLGEKITEIAGKVADIVSSIWDAIEAFKQWKETTKENIRTGLENSGLFHNLPTQSRASGGYVSAGQIYQVNDDHARRREMFIPAVSGYILNGRDTEKVVNNTATYGDTIVYVNSYGTNAAEIAEEIGVELNRKLRLSGAG